MTTLAEPGIVEYLFSKLDFTPTEKQEPILSCRKRFILVAGGEQALSLIHISEPTRPY